MRNSCKNSVPHAGPLREKKLGPPSQMGAFMDLQPAIVLKTRLLPLERPKKIIHQNSLVYHNSTTTCAYRISRVFISRQPFNMVIWTHISILYRLIGINSSQYQGKIKIHQAETPKPMHIKKIQLNVQWDVCIAAVENVVVVDEDDDHDVQWKRNERESLTKTE